MFSNFLKNFANRSYHPQYSISVGSQTCLGGTEKYPWVAPLLLCEVARYVARANLFGGVLNRDRF